MSLADELLPAEPERASGVRPRMVVGDGDDLFGKVNALPTTDVLSWLGVETAQIGSRTIVKCPNCGAFDDTSSAIVDGGVKCLHATCSDSGPVGAPGFRTAVDLTMVVRGLKAIDAARELAAAFNIPVPERRREQRIETVTGLTDEEPPEWLRDGDEEAPSAPQATVAAVTTEAQPAAVAVQLPGIITEQELLVGACKRAVSKEERNVCSTGHFALDRMTGGFLPGWCWVVGANTNWGKSSWCVAVADTNLLAGRQVLIVSLEDAPELYGDRLMLRRARRRNDDKINADHLRLRKLTFREMELADLVRKEARPRPLLLDARGRRGEWIAKSLAALLDANPIDLVLIDYLGEVRSGSRQQDKRNEVSEMAALLRGVVKRRNRALVMLSQVTMGEDPDKFPRMNQIRDSRDVVNAAEVVAMCGIPQGDMKTKAGSIIAEAGTRAMVLEKVKQGRKGPVGLHWDDEAACFVDVADPHSSDDPPFRSGTWSPNGAPAPDPREPRERDEDEYGIPAGF